MDWKFWLPTFLAGVQSLYSVLSYYQDRKAVGQGAAPVKSSYVIPGIIMFLTWGAVAFNYYDRHYAQPASERFLHILSGWGTGEDNCHATLDASQVLDFGKQYQVAYVCIIEDLRVDMLDETTISVSNPYHIISSRISMVAPMRKEMLDIVIQNTVTGNTEGTMWHVAVLVPPGIDMNAIRQLSDVKRYGGKILHPKYFEE